MWLYEVINMFWKAAELLISNRHKKLHEKYISIHLYIFLHSSLNGTFAVSINIYLKFNL